MCTGVESFTTSIVDSLEKIQYISGYFESTAVYEEDGFGTTTADAYWDPIIASLKLAETLPKY